MVFLNSLCDSVQCYWHRFKVGGQARWQNLGRVGDVRLGQVTTTVTAARNSIEVEKRDLVAEKQADTATGTFDTLYHQWRDCYAIPTLDPENVRREHMRYGLHIAPRIGSKSASKLTRLEIKAVLDDITVNVGRPTARFVRDTICGIYTWAEDAGIITAHPARGIKLAGKEKPRNKAWAPDDLKRFWIELDDMHGSPSAVALKLLVLLGKRIGEVCGARQRDLRLDGEHPGWFLPAPDMKNREEHDVPLPPLAVELFRAALKLAGEHEFVFPPRNGSKGPHMSTTGLTTTRMRILDELGIEGLTTHDLRTTLNTGTRALGVAHDVRKALLSHKADTDDVTDRV